MLLTHKREEKYMADEKKRLYPGDVGYPGGIFHTTVYVDGKAKDVKTVKDPNGNVVAVFVTDKIFGIF